MVKLVANFTLLFFLGISTVHGKLKFEDVKEEGCVTTAKSTIKTMSFDWLLDLAEGKKFFMPTGSRSVYYLWMEIIDSTKSLESESELMSQMCPTFTVTMSSLNISSFGSFLLQNCTLESTGNVKCKTEPSTRADSELIFNWTDNKENMLVIFCIGTKYRAWGLFSMVPKIEPGLQTSIQEKIKEFGFDSKKSLVYNYAECKL